MHSDDIIKQMNGIQYWLDESIKVLLYMLPVKGIFIQPESMDF